MLTGIVNGIKGYFESSLINYGVFSVPRSRFIEIARFIIRTAVAVAVMNFMMDATLTDSILTGIAIVLIFVISAAAAYFSGKDPRIGEFTLKNIIVTFAAGSAATGILFFLLFGDPLTGGLEIFVTILCFGGSLGWALGLLKSFGGHMVESVRLMNEDDGTVTIQYPMTTVTKSLFSDTYVARDTSFYDKRWTLQTYLYHARVFGLCARITFGLFYAVTVGIFLAGFGTLMSIVSVANPAR